jgi:hypothetical protein
MMNLGFIGVVSVWTNPSAKATIWRGESRRTAQLSDAGGGVELPHQDQDCRPTPLAIHPYDDMIQQICQLCSAYDHGWILAKLVPLFPLILTWRSSIHQQWNEDSARNTIQNSAVRSSSLQTASSPTRLCSWLSSGITSGMCFSRLIRCRYRSCFIKAPELTEKEW